ncbi:MAG: uracil-xanthine permease family protein [Lactovum sp.]
MNDQNDLLIDVHEKPKSVFQWVILSLQHVFAMFGSTILVPALTGLPMSVALFASGIGTLIYITVTKAKVPVYLGSSFAYIAAISLYTSQDNEAAAYTGLVLVGIIYLLIALVIKLTSKNWIDKLLPPIVVGPMIIVIGLGLASVAVSDLGLSPATYGDVDLVYPLVGLITFSVTVAFALMGNGFLRVIPFIFGILAGYISSIIFGIVDLSKVFVSDSFFKLPDFQFMFLDYSPDFTGWAVFIPLAFVTIAEHIGDHTVLGAVTNKDYLHNPGLDKTLTGDGLATAVSALLGGPANTTYGENTGVIAMTKIASVWVIGLAAIFAIFLSFLAPIQDFLNSIPSPVMGGISLLLFGLIASNGLKILIKAKVDINDMGNLVIISAMLVIGLGGATIFFTENVTLTGMALAAVVGISLNQIIQLIKK